MQTERAEVDQRAARLRQTQQTRPREPNDTALLNGMEIITMQAVVDAVTEMDLPRMTEADCLTTALGLRELEKQKIIKWVRVKTRYAKGDVWRALSLHGFGEHHTDILKPGVLGSKLQREVALVYTDLWQTEEMDSVTAIIHFVKEATGCHFERIRFMQIKAHCGIGKHTDRIDKTIGTDDGQIMRLHMPILTNSLVDFNVWQGREMTTHHLSIGRWYYLDAHKAHAVQNNSGIDRVHLVADAYATERLRASVRID